jgi:hypothetical protein
VLWVLVDVLLAVLALALLGAVALRTYRHLRTLLKAVSASSSAVVELTPGLQVVPPDRPQR